LFVNGQRRIRARTPNVGSFKFIDGATSTLPPFGQFTFHPGDILSQWTGPSNVELITLQSWADTRMYILAVDQNSRTVTLSGAFSSFYQEPNARYWVENTLDALDSPGEWYLDVNNGLLYYYPVAGENMQRANVIAPVVTSLVQFQGNHLPTQQVTNIKLLGL